MNAHLQSIFDGAIDTINETVLPQISEEFSRGQLAALVFILSELKLRTDWSSEWLLEQIDAQLAAFGEIARLAQAASIEPPTPPFTAIDRRLSPAQLEDLRDRGEQHVCRIQDWISESRADATLPSDRIRSVLLGYMKIQCGSETRLTPQAVYGNSPEGSKRKEPE
jgi:hypothetical protein